MTDINCSHFRCIELARENKELKARLEQRGDVKPQWLYVRADRLEEAIRILDSFCATTANQTADKGKS